MTIGLPVRLRIWCVLLLSASLVSCSSSQDVPQATSASHAPAKPSGSKAPLREAQPSDPTPTKTEEAPSPSETHSAAPSHDPEASAPSVEAATVHPSPAQEKASGKSSFQSKSPVLAHLKLGSSDKEIIKRYGPPAETYPLPDDAETIDIWEYGGLSIGLNERDKIVYIEVNSADVDTGIEGLAVGMKGSKVAEALGIPGDERTNVLSMEVAGGWLKIDLDPDTQNILSLKLLLREI